MKSSSIVRLLFRFGLIPILSNDSVLVISYITAAQNLKPDLHVILVLYDSIAVGVLGKMRYSAILYANTDRQKYEQLRIVI